MTFLNIRIVVNSVINLVKKNLPRTALQICMFHFNFTIIVPNAFNYLKNVTTWEQCSVEFELGAVDYSRLTIFILCNTILGNQNGLRESPCILSDKSKRTPRSSQSIKLILIYYTACPKIGVQITYYLPSRMFKCTVNFKIIEYTSKIKKSIYYSFFHM
jgi:hypothetical protein